MNGFIVGERVHHVGMEENGTVETIFNGAVHVQYDRVGAKGAPWRGQYDELWFRLYPLGLIHGERAKRTPAQDWTTDEHGNLTRSKGAEKQSSA